MTVARTRVGGEAGSAMRRRGAHTTVRTRAAVAVLGVLAALLLAAPAPAAEPLVLKSQTPANGAPVAPTPVGGIAWQITIAGPPPEADVSVTVSSTPATGPDGLLPSTDRVDSFFLTQNPTAADAYAGTSDPGPNPWSAVAATYYCRWSRRGPMRCRCSTRQRARSSAS